jgi:hypothetical protein
MHHPIYSSMADSFDELEALREKNKKLSSTVASQARDIEELKEANAQLHAWTSRQLTDLKGVIMQMQAKEEWAEWRVSGMQERIRKATVGIQWHRAALWSPDLMTQSGYVVQLSIELNGHNEEQAGFLSVYINFKKGPNDEYLMWPFEGTATVEVPQRSMSLSSDSNEKWTEKACRCKPTASSGNSRYGWGNFLPHESIMEDTLVFRIKLQQTLVTL